MATSSPFANLSRAVRHPAPTPAAEAPSIAPAPAAEGPVEQSPTVETAAPEVTGEVTGEAPAQAVTVAVEAATTTDESVTLHVVTGHSSSQAGAILTGVVGVVKDDKFEIDPSYAQVSYLFTLAGGGLIDASTRLAPVTLPNAAVAKEFISNMIAANSKCWAQMYERVGSQHRQGDIVGSMLAAEQTAVANGARNVVASANLKTYLVPVNYEVMVDQSTSAQRSGIETAQQLINSGRVVPLSIAPVAPVDALPILKDEAAINAFANGDQPLTDEQKAHNGAFDIEVNGFIEILSNSPEGAKAVFEAMSSIPNVTIARNVLTVVPLSFQNMSLTPYECEFEDDSDDDSDDDYRMRG